jgi:flagellar FliJ protein
VSFKFRLQRILELREQSEQAKARQLAAAQNEAERAALAQQSLQSLRADSRAQLQAAAESAPRVGHLTQLGTVLDALDQRLVLASDAVKEADAGVQQARDLLEIAARDRRVLDRLKARHEDAHRADEAHKDRVQMDEVALNQFARKQDAGSGAPAESATPRDGTTR